MRRTVGMVITLTALFVAIPLHAQERLTVNWNDPSRPGLLKVNWHNGAITVKTHSGNDVVIETTAGRENRRPAPAEAGGLRRIDAGGPGLIVESENNVMTVNAQGFRGNGDLEIEVPVRTNLTLQTMNGRAINVDGVEGEIEVTNHNGIVNLTNVAGSVVAHSMNGRVIVSFRDIAAGKAMSFTSMNGNVDVTLPPAAKANLKMRTDNGEVYTDFDIQVRPNSATPAVQNQGSRYRIEVDKTINGAINGGGADLDLRTHNGNIYLRKSK
jgi:DUF4097 and DUF4098 domain-containing protein YvlB